MVPTVNDNRALIEKVKRREMPALAEYLAEVRRRLCAFIERHLGPALRRKVEVDDIYQEISVEAVRSLSEADFEHREPFHWLCQMAERRIIDAHRRFFDAQKRDAGREVPLGSSGADSEHAALIDMLVASMTSPTHALSRKGHELRLFQALADLPADQQEALRLRYLDGLPSKEIAARMGKSDGSVRVMLTRALSRLQQILGPDEAPR